MPSLTRCQCALTCATRPDTEHDAWVVGTTTFEPCCERRRRVAVERNHADADVDAFRAGKRGVQERSRIRVGGDAIEPEALVARLLGQRRENADGFGPERARYADAPFRLSSSAYATRERQSLAVRSPDAAYLTGCPGKGGRMDIHLYTQPG